MADEANTDFEPRAVGGLKPDGHDQWHLDLAERTARASWPATTYSPPPWWQDLAAAHDLEQAQKRGQLNLM